MDIDGDGYAAKQVAAKITVVPPGGSRKSMTPEIGVMAHGTNLSVASFSRAIMSRLLLGSG
jgi:hypothetical protein